MDKSIAGILFLLNVVFAFINLSNGDIAYCVFGLIGAIASVALLFADPKPEE